MIKNNNYEEISLYNVATLFREYLYKYELISYNANQQLIDMYGECIDIVDYDYRNNVLIVLDMNTYGTVIGDCVELYLDSNNELKNKPSINGTFIKFIYDDLKEFMIKVIQEYLNNKDFAIYEYNEERKKTNIFINYSSIIIKTPKYEINYHYHNDIYKVYDSYGNEKKILKTNIDEVFNNIYIKINKLPKFMQEELYTMRREELDEGMIRKRIFFKEFFEY